MANNVRGFVINSLNQFNEYLQENILPSYSNKQSDWNTSNTNDDSYIKNKPTIPPEVTESTVAGWGFTKNTGSLTIETDPVFAASAAHGISSSDITTWNNKVSNVQGDWSVTDSSSEAYIKNKPTIPSIEGLATETYVTNKVAGIVNSAPETLDTLNELATALGNDPNFATTTATALGNRVTKDELAGLGYVTQTTLSNQSYVTTTALSNQSYVTQTSLSSNSYAGYSYVYDAYSYIITSIIDNELVTSTALNNHESRIDSLENAGYITSFTESDPIFVASAAHGISSSDITAWNNKVSNVQGDWNESNSSSGAYINNKPTIPAEVTESTVSGWGFTKNEGTLTSHAKHKLTVATGTTNANSGNSITFIESLSGTTTATDGDLTITPTKKTITIPSEVTESTVSGWGFTKNEGTLTSHATHKLTATNETATSTSGTITFVESLTGTNTATSGDLTVTATRKSVTIPSEVTESTVSGWGFTKNAGTLTSHATHKLTATNETATSTSGTITFVESLTGTNTATSGDLTVTATRKSVTIPSEVTESTVSGWGFTKNAGTLTSHATHKLTATNGNATSTSGTITFVESLTGTDTATSGDLTVTATRKSITIPTVNDTTITITKGSYTGTFTTNASTAKTINLPNELPSYSSSDEGKVLSVNSSGQLVWITPVSIYTGNGTPDNSQGNNGDIYIQQ